jgi:16S rRNA (adenine1518-N6/adenine1519-N6)-dimethyltransferase
MNLPSIAEVVKAYGLLENKKHSKKMGQNFLFDMSITRKIAGIFPLEHVVEIGPGPGGLTRAILEHAKTLIAIEKDPNCVGALGILQDHYNEKLKIICDDALKIDVFSLRKEPFRIVANLPYNIGTALLVNWIKGLTQNQNLLSMTLMLQKEVVDRIIASPDTKDYGRLSILCQYACHVRREFNVDPRCFTPSPKVMSSVVTLIPKERTFIQKISNIEHIAKIAFGQRRKMIRNTLGKFYPEIPLFNQEKRPESIALNEWIHMAEMISV